MTKILITGGGTGGHVQPAMAVIAELRKRDADIELLYVGSANSVESKLAAEAGVPFTSVSVGKLRRSSKGVRGLLTTQNFVDALRVPVGVIQAYRAVRSYKPGRGARNRRIRKCAYDHRGRFAKASRVDS